jgi:hypothetical protein
MSANIVPLGANAPASSRGQGQALLVGREIPSHAPCSVASRELCQSRTRANGEACYGEQPKSCVPARPAANKKRDVSLSSAARMMPEWMLSLKDQVVP